MSKKVKGLIITGVVVGLVFIGMIAMAGCDSSDSSDSNTHEIKLEVTGTEDTIHSDIDITFMNGTGDIVQYAARPLGWSEEFEAEAGDFVSIMAQNDGTDRSFTVEIYIDGELVESSTSYGKYTIASTDTIV